MSLDPERIAEVLVDAFARGDGPAARRWHLSTRTIRNYRARLRTDAALAAIFREKQEDTEAELSALRVRFLRRTLVVLEKKCAKAKATVYEVAGAVKIVGELHQVAEELDERDDEEPGQDDPGTEGVEAGAAHGPH